MRKNKKEETETEMGERERKRKETGTNKKGKGRRETAQKRLRYFKTLRNVPRDKIKGLL